VSNIFSEIIDIGFVPAVNTKVKITRAAKKLAVTQAIRIKNLLNMFAFIKLSFALNSSSCLGSSPFNLTNHHKGIRFNVYSVPLLSVRNLHIFGGIQIPNSNTFTQLLFAAIKCQSSWINTNPINIKIPIINPISKHLKIKLIKNTKKPL